MGPVAASGVKADPLRVDGPVVTATAPSSRTSSSSTGPAARGGDAPRPRDAITAGLAEPVGEIVRTLQQLALAQLDDRDDPLDPRLVDRARSLAHALQMAIEELIAEGTRRGALDTREPQTIIHVGDAFAAAGATCRTALSGRRVVVRGEQAALVTAPERFHELAVTLLESAAAVAVAGSDIRVIADRQRTELLLEVEGVRLPADSLDRIRTLARALGGSVQPSRAGSSVAVSIWLPQQREGDDVA